MGRRHHGLPFDGRHNAMHPLEIAARAARSAREAEERAEVERQKKAAQEGAEAPTEPESEAPE